MSLFGKNGKQQEEAKDPALNEMEQKIMTMRAVKFKQPFKVIVGEKTSIQDASGKPTFDIKSPAITTVGELQDVIFRLKAGQYVDIALLNSQLFMILFEQCQLLETRLDGQQYANALNPVKK